MAFFCTTVNFSFQILKSKHLVCLSFIDISRDSRAKIYLSMEKMWALITTSTLVSLTTAQTHNLLVQSQRSKGWHMGWQFIRLGSRIHLKKYYEEWWQIGCDRRKSPVEAEEAFLSFPFLCKTVSIDQWCVLCPPFQVHPLLSSF